MTTEPIIGVDEQHTTEGQPGSSRPTSLALVCLGIAALALVGIGLGGEGRQESQEVGPLDAPVVVTREGGRIHARVAARSGSGHLDWQRLSLDGHRLQAAGEVAGRLVLAIEDPEGVSLIGFVSPAGLVPGIAVSSPVDHVAAWNDRLLLVGADVEGPVLHLQQADGTLRRLATARFSGEQPVAQFAEMVPVANRLLAVSEPPSPVVRADLPAEVRTLVAKTGASFMARGREVVVEAAPGIVVLRRNLIEPPRSAAPPSVWSSTDGEGWEPVTEATYPDPALAALGDGGTLLSGSAGALVTADGRSWQQFEVPLGTEAARGRHRLWADGPFGPTTIMTSTDGQNWHPVDLAPLAPDPSWEVGAVESGPAGYAVELIAPPPRLVEVDTDTEGVTVSVARDHTNLRLADGTVLTPNAYRADVDLDADTVTFRWDDRRSATVGLAELMAADASRRGAGLVVTSLDGRVWATVPIERATSAKGTWVSGSTVVIDEGATMLVGTVR